VTDAPYRIWAFHAPHIAGDEAGATIVAHDSVQHGGQRYVRADLYVAAIDRAEAAEAEVERLTRVLREITDFPGRRWQRKAARDALTDPQ
jgi:hypothetical protein